MSGGGQEGHFASDKISLADESDVTFVHRVDLGAPSAVTKEIFTEIHQQEFSKMSGWVMSVTGRRDVSDWVMSPASLAADLLLRGPLLGRLEQTD